MSLKSLPLSKMPRTIRKKCVRGNTSPMCCAHTGMPRKGNMNPESSREGKKKKKAICTAWSWFSATVEKVIPMARLAAMNTMDTRSSNGTLPTMGIRKT